ncbi:glycosyltransferase [Synechococcus sp. BMK-MC-1]|uniref:glycosyltransferase n=1 Tax=Synechococcus sp. BMK-MC-1 TaxID=1442551 RepID=UPI001646C09B|nr:glycosyltransferase [Synechococcus sp. BMK-MC-1]QNI66368.1 beta-glycosyltransferase/ family 2 [Synechococcus sp. BMK-MC-1]
MSANLNGQELYAQAATAVEQASWGRAEALLRRLLALQPDHASGHHLLGKSLRAVGEPHQALAAQQRSCALDPWLGWNWFAAGELLMEQQRWPEAAEAFAWALHALPAEGWIAHQLQQARSAGVVAGDSYQHWIRHHEPRLPDPFTPLTQQFWTLDGQGQWRALHGSASLQPRRAPLGASPWPVEGWLVLLGPQTQLRPGALQALEGWLAQALPWQQAGQAVADLSPRQRGCWALPDVMYADEDRFEPDGRRCDPWFKPGWVPESFWSSPWLGGLSVWRLSWLRHQTLPLPPTDPAGRFRWQLAALERSPRIEPCPLLLSHQGMASGGPQGRADQDSQLEAEAAALFAHLQAQGEAVQAVTPLPQRPGCFQLHWALPKRVGCSLLIPTRDRADLLQVCLQSVWDSTEAARAQGIDLALVLIDNGSVEQATTELLCRWQQRLGDAMTTVRLEQPFNWSQLNNQAAARARGEVLLCLNNDIEARQSGWLEAMVAQALRPVVGCVGANLLYPDGTLQHGGVVLGVHGGADHAYRHLPLSHGVHRGRSGLLTGWGAVTGACLMLRRELLIQLGGFDEGLPVEFNDVDLCLRLGSLGYRHVIPPEAVLIHHESQSRDAQASRTAHQALQRLQGRWPGRLRSGSPWWPQQMEPNHVDGRPLGMAVCVD